MAIPRWLSTLIKTWFMQELWASLKLFGPIATAYVLSQSLSLVSLIFCGHYPKDTALVLEASGLSNSIINLTALITFLGMGSAMDTLATQAYGAQSYKKVGVYLQRGILIHALGLLVVLAIWANIESILNLLHQPPCVIKYTVIFFQGFSFALPALLFYFTLEKYLQAQGIVYPFIVTEIAATAVSVLAHYLLMFVADLGILGAGIALGLSQYAALVFLLGFIWIRKLHKETWGGWSWESLNDWGQYAKYSISGLIMSIAEVAVYEMGMFVVGLTGSLQQSILAVLVNFYYVMFTVSYSLRTTTNVRIGNKLGAGDPKGAKRALFVGLCLACIWLVPAEVVTLALKDYIPMVFTSDPTILKAINVHIYVIAVSVFCDALYSILAGAILGCGWQHVGAGLNIMCYWIVGTPLAVSLALAVPLGALGYLMGLTTASILSFCLHIVAISAVKWKKQAERAQKMAILPQKGDLNKEGVSRSSENADASKEQSSNAAAGNCKPCSRRDNVTDSEKDFSKKDESDLQGNPSTPAGSPNGMCTPDVGKEKTTEQHHHKVESQENKRKSASRWKMVMLRITVASPFIILCVGALITSKLFVYQSSATCNRTIAGNKTEFQVSHIYTSQGAVSPTVTNSHIPLLATPTPNPPILK